MKVTKRVLIVIVAILCCGGLECAAQTYCYKYLYTVNSDTGEKSMGGLKAHNIYITFTNNKNYCYESDKNGIKKEWQDPVYISGIFKEGANQFYYTSSNNGMFTYRCVMKTCQHTFNGKNVISETIFFKTFSRDYKRLNSKNKDYPNVRVYERVENNQNDMPTQMW
ncbi:MAG: hypothetical protein IIW52_04470 [Alistipes sp.]|nr:hypothetical protein [Alistipes sp.]